MPVNKAWNPPASVWGGDVDDRPGSDKTKGFPPIDHLHERDAVHGLLCKVGTAPGAPRRRLLAPGEKLKIEGPASLRFKGNGAALLKDFFICGADIEELTSGVNVLIPADLEPGYYAVYAAVDLSPDLIYIESVVVK